MSAEPARDPRQLQQALDQMEQNHRMAIDATRTRLAEVPQPANGVSRDDLGRLPVGATPNVAAKDLIAKYGRAPSPAVERTPVPEPER